MRDWDKTIDELRKNIEDARKRWVLPYLDPTQFDAKTSENKSTANAEEKNNSTDVSDIEKPNTEDPQVVSSNEIDETPAEEVKDEKVEEVQKVDAAQVDAMLDEVKSEEAPAEEVKDEKVEEDTKTSAAEKNKPVEKPKRGKKKVKEVKPDFVLLELAELEAINENDLSEEQEDRLMELRRIKTQRAMHVEADEQFQSEMKQADEEIKTLKSQLKIKDPLPKGYIE